LQPVRRFWALSGGRCDAFQHHQAAHVIGQILHPDLHGGPGHADGADELSAHGAVLIAEHMFDPCAHLRAGLVGSLLTRRERLAPAAAPVDMAPLSQFGEFRLGLGAAIGTVGPYPAGSVTGIEHVLKLLAVMHRGAADRITPHQLVAPINADMVLVYHP